MNQNFDWALAFLVLTVCTSAAITFLTSAAELQSEGGTGYWKDLTKAGKAVLFLSVCGILAPIGQYQVNENFESKTQQHFDSTIVHLQDSTSKAIKRASDSVGVWIDSTKELNRRLADLQARKIDTSIANDNHNKDTVVYTIKAGDLLIFENQTQEFKRQSDRAERLNLEFLSKEYRHAASLPFAIYRQYWKLNMGNDFVKNDTNRQKEIISTMLETTVAELKEMLNENRIVLGAPLLNAEYQKVHDALDAVLGSLQLYNPTSLSRIKMDITNALAWFNGDAGRLVKNENGIMTLKKFLDSQILTPQLEQYK